jgi:hypothetical protein
MRFAAIPACRRPTQPRFSSAGAPGICAGLLLLFAAGSHAALYSRGNVVVDAAADHVPVGLRLATGDFDGDGLADLVIGAPSATVGGQVNAGEVQVRYGSPTGPGLRLRLYQGVVGILGEPELDDYFGSSLAAGDFDGDGYDDLALGVPFEDLSSGSTPVPDCGVVEVLYGSPTGLTATGSQLWSQDSTGITGVPEDDDHFGSALAAGDFDGDGFDDLAIGARGEDIGAVEEAGGIWILRGGLAGLSATLGNSFDEAAAGGTVAAFRHFGGVLASGDLDGNDRDELVAGVAQEAVGGHPGAGVVWIFPGTPSGLSFPGTRIYQGAVLPSGTVYGVAEDNDGFGSALAIGDFDRVNAQSARYDDLAIGVNGESASSGAVEIVYGGPTGISAAGSLLFREIDLPGGGATFSFGAALAAGPLRNGFRSDLVVASPFDTVEGQTNVGRVWVVPGTADGPALDDAVAWDTSTPGLASGPVAMSTLFGSSIAIGNFDGRGVRDLAIGVPGLDPLGDASRLGGIQILFSALFASDFATHDLTQWSSHIP